MYRPPRSLTPASFSPPELSNLWVRNGPKILPPKTGKCGINGVLLMNWICCVYGVFPGNLLKSHNLNPLFFPFGDVLFDDKLLLSQPLPKCCVCPSCVTPNLSWGVLGSAISLSCCEKTAVTAWVLPGENM